MKKKVFIVFMILLVIFIISGCILLVLYNKEKSKMTLLNSNVVIEYGDIYKPEFKELIDLSKYHFVKEDDIKLESNITNEKDKDYPSVGEYEVKLYYKDIILKQIVEVRDTIAPELSIEEKVEIPFGTNLNTYDFQDIVKISDLSEVKEVEINTDDVDVNLSGEYIAKIMVSDIYSNVTEKEFKIFVQEQEQPDETIVDDSINNQTTNTNDNSKAQIRNSQNNQNTELKEQPQPSVEITETVSQENVSSNVQAESSNTEQVPETPPAQQEEKLSCADGGPIHALGDGKNEHRIL